MLTLLLALAFDQAPQPDPTVWYQQATACMGSALAAGPRAGEPPPDTFSEDALAWGVVMNFAGPAARHPTEADQAADAEAAEAFFRQVRELRPEAFEAHRTWRRAIRS